MADRRVSQCFHSKMLAAATKAWWPVCGRTPGAHCHAIHSLLCWGRIPQKKLRKWEASPHGKLLTIWSKQLSEPRLITCALIPAWCDRRTACKSGARRSIASWMTSSRCNRRSPRKSKGEYAAGLHEAAGSMPEISRPAVPSIFFSDARAAIRARDGSKIAEAHRQLKQAVRMDPNFAPAWATLAVAERLIHPGISDSQASGNEAEADAGPAITLAPNLASPTLRSALPSAVRARLPKPRFAARSRLIRTMWKA